MPDEIQRDHPEIPSEYHLSPSLLQLRGHFGADEPPPALHRGDWRSIREAYPITEDHALLVSPTKAALAHAPGQEILWTITCPSKGASALHLGRHLLALGSNEQIFVWDLHTGSLMSQFDVETEEPNSLAFSADGSLLAVGLYATGVQVWQVTRGRLLYTLLEPDGAEGYWGVAISPDGQWLASGTHEWCEVWVWRLADGQFVHRLQEPGGRVAGVAVSPDGRLLVCGDGGGARVAQAMRVWEMPEGRAVRRFPCYHGSKPAFSPDGRLFAVVGRPSTGWQRTQGGMIFVWEVDSRRELQRLIGDTAGVMHLAFSPNGSGLVSCSVDGTVRWWDLASGQERYRLESRLLY